MKEKLSIGIALDCFELPAWKNRLLEKLAADGYAMLSTVLLVDGASQSLSPRSGLWQWHMKLDAQYFKPQPNAFQKVKSNDLFKNSQEMDFKDLASLEHLSLDLVLWLSETPPPSALYQQVNIGVLYFSNGVDGKVDENFLGYTEFIEMAEVITSALMLQSTPEGKHQEIYRTWSMMPTLSISRARNEHMWKLVSFVPRAIRAIHAAGLSHFIKKENSNSSENSTPIHLQNKLPSNFTSLINLGRHFTRMGKKAIRKTGFREQWILLLNNKKGSSTSFADFTKILPPKNCFWADPFLVEKDQKQYLFIEELPFATDKGHLSVMEIDAKGKVSPPVKILDQPYHLSYPFIFEVEGTHYMIPESYEDKSIQLYECTGFPFHWTHKMNLMSELAAFDTTLYFHEGKWWMFTLISEQQGAGHNDELFLFFADTPFTTEWKSHPQNPIISDVRIARPAGNIYKENGKIIRPSQDCARKYGYGFNLNEIEVLTETEYREKCILNVRPDWDASLSRTHSFNHLPGMTVIDAVIQRSRFF